MRDIAVASWVIMARIHIVNTILVFRGVLFSRIHDLLQSYFPVVFSSRARRSASRSSLYIFIDVNQALK